MALQSNGIVGLQQQSTFWSRWGTLLATLKEQIRIKIVTIIIITNAYLAFTLHQALFSWCSRSSLQPLLFKVEIHKLEFCQKRATWVAWWGDRSEPRTQGSYSHMRCRESRTGTRVLSTRARRTCLMLTRSFLTGRAVQQSNESLYEAVSPPSQQMYK